MFASLPFIMPGMFGGGSNDGFPRIRFEELLEEMVSNFIKQDFEANKVQETYKVSFFLFVDPTLFDGSYEFRPDANILVPTVVYSNLALMHPYVLAFRTDRNGFTFDFKGGSASCDIQHVNIAHSAKGYSEWKLSFSNFKFETKSYYGMKPCSVALAVEKPEWKGEEAYCFAIRCSVCHKRIGCKTHNPTTKECKCKREVE